MCFWYKHWEDSKLSLNLNTFEVWSSLEDISTTWVLRSSFRSGPRAWLPNVLDEYEKSQGENKDLLHFNFWPIISSVLNQPIKIIIETE